jgi:hypothetical protein
VFCFGAFADRHITKPDQLNYGSAGPFFASTIVAEKAGQFA